MKIIVYFLLLVVVIFGVGFSCLNMEVVNVNYYFGLSQLPLALLLALTFAFGGVLGVFASLGLFVRIKAKSFALSHKLKNAEKELDALRTISTKE